MARITHCGCILVEVRDGRITLQRGKSTRWLPLASAVRRRLVCKEEVDLHQRCHHSSKHTEERCTCIE